jgi:hypothetical protein
MSEKESFPQAQAQGKAVAVVPRGRGVSVRVGTSCIVAIGGAVSLVVLGWSAIGLLALIGGGVAALVFRLIQGIEAGASGGGGVGGTGSNDAVEALKRGLFKSQYIPGAEALGEQASEQLRQLGDRFRNFQKLLTEKLSPSELTFGRFNGAAENVYLSVIENLRTILSELRSLESSDPGYAQDRLKQATDGAEITALKERLALRDTRVTKVRALLSENEKALTQLDQAISAIGAMGTGPKLASTDLDTALQELEEIAQRARKFQ